MHMEKSIEILQLVNFFQTLEEHVIITQPETSRIRTLNGEAAGSGTADRDRALVASMLRRERD